MKMTTQEQREMDAHWRWQKWQQRKEVWLGTLKSFGQWCKHEDNYSINFLERVFYVFKCLFCVLLNRTSTQSYPDDICVSLVWYSTWYGGWNSCTLHVEHGVFKGWKYFLRHDGDCSM